MKFFVLYFFSSSLIILAILFFQHQHFKKKLFKKEEAFKDQIHQALLDFKKNKAKELENYHCLAEVGRLTSGILHDLVNPLTALILNLEQTRFSNLSEIKVDEWEQKLNEGSILCDRMTRLIKAASKQLSAQAEEKDWFLINEEIINVLNLLNYKAQLHQVNLRSNLEENLFLNNNSIKFNRIISNLVSNAIEAVDTNKKSSWVEIKTRAANDHLLITITDNGLGFPNHLKDKLFEPFFSTKGGGHNLGLGLAIVLDLVKKDFSGDLRVVSAAGKFTSFTIDLPLNKKTSE
ncbi:MAG: sensor histidine kinase [Patescibacteria group bacterium]|jgi:two-component system NtrC family sensor kinase